MKKIIFNWLNSFILFCILLGSLASELGAKDKDVSPKDKDTKKVKQTIIVSAEGLADPNAQIYQKDRALMVDDLRNDAKKQVIEKAVGVYVDSRTIVENYVTLEDRVFSKSSGLIKEVIKESSPWVGEDGFAHMLMRAEVYIGDLKSALEDMSKAQRKNIIKIQGNPRISVRIDLRDAQRGGDATKERSDVAENKLKEHIKKFGYAVWSDEGDSPSNMPDFTIIGEAKFKTLKHKLEASGINIEKTVLTSWSVKCLNRHTKEEIYFNNKIPKKQSWNSEDEAIEEIGNMIGKEFSADFFTEHLNNPIKTFQLEIVGLPDFDTAQLFKKEFLGLRSILNVDFRTFNAQGISVYEIDFGGVGDNFASILNDGVIAPLNQKLGAGTFGLISVEGNSIKINFNSKMDKNSIQKSVDTLPPASIAEASAQRLASIVKSEQAQEKVKNLVSIDNKASIINNNEAKKSINNF